MEPTILVGSYPTGPTTYGTMRNQRLTIDDRIEPGKFLLVENNPKSLWFEATYTIASYRLRSGGSVVYDVFALKLDDVRSGLTKLGVDVNEVEYETRMLRTYDWHKYIPGIRFSQVEEYYRSLEGMPTAELIIGDDYSSLARTLSQDEFEAFILDILMPPASTRESTIIAGVTRGGRVTEQMLKDFEPRPDGIIEITIRKGETNIRMARMSIPHDSHPHPLKKRSSKVVFAEAELSED